MMSNLRTKGYHVQSLATVVEIGEKNLYCMYDRAIVELDGLTWVDMFVFEDEGPRKAGGFPNTVDPCRKTVLVREGAEKEGGVVRGARSYGRAVQAFHAATTWLQKDLAPGAHDLEKEKISALHTHTVGMGQVHHFDYDKVLHQPVLAVGGCRGGPLKLHSALSLLLPLEGECSLMVDTLATAQVSASCGFCGPANAKKGCMEYIEVDTAMEGWSRPPGANGMDEVIVRRGQVLIFLDRVAHGGGAAKNGQNRRLHGYWPSTDSLPPDNRVFPVPTHCSCGFSIAAFRGNGTAK